MSTDAECEWVTERQQALKEATRAQTCMDLATDFEQHLELGGDPAAIPGFLRHLADTHTKGAQAAMRRARNLRETTC